MLPIPILRLLAPAAAANLLALVALVAAPPSSAQEPPAPAAPESESESGAEAGTEPAKPPVAAAAELESLRQAYASQIEAAMIPQLRKYHAELMKLEDEFAARRDYESAARVKMERGALEARLGDKLAGALPEAADLPPAAPEEDLLLLAKDGEISGEGVKLIAGGAVSFEDAGGALAWKLPRALSRGGYEIIVEYGCAIAGGGAFALREPFYFLRGKAEPTGGWDAYKPVMIGTLRVKERADTLTFVVPASSGHILNLRSIRVVPASRDSPPDGGV